MASFNNIDYQALPAIYEVVRPPVTFIQYLDPGSAYLLLGTQDTTPPAIGNFVPTVGSTILPASSVQFDVTDASGLRRVILIAEFADGSWDAVHDGDSFSPKYAAASTRAPITNGYTFSVARVGGWLLSPTFRIVAIDLMGNETS